VPYRAGTHPARSLVPISNLPRPTQCKTSRVSTRTTGLAAGLAVIATAGILAAPVASAATSRAFTASYSGHGSGQVNGTRASGSATLTGRGRFIGPGTLSGSGHGVFVSRTCIVFSGRAVLKGRRGSIRLAARHARACSTSGNKIAFSGTARVTGGSATFAGARGALSFGGTYLRRSGAVTISFRGRISY
jgi:hypothetical protein